MVGLSRMEDRARAVALAFTLLACASCRDRDFDNVDICFPLTDDRIVVELRAACASDHEGAKLSCELDVDGNDVHVTAHGRDGRDPNGACADDLVATCETDELADGIYTVHFDDGTFEVEVPNNDEESCAEEI